MSATARQRLVEDLNVSRETLARIDAYAARLIAANEQQNLIGRQSVAQLWDRHILDSAQLHPLVAGRALDVGSGAGLPGLVLAIMGSDMTLVEPRRLRAAFLSETAAALDAPATIHQCSVEQLKGAPFDSIAARAYAALDRIFESTLHLSHPGTRWVLPKGRTGMSELEVARRAWHGDFRTLPSITDPDAVIIVATNVKRKAQR